MYLNEQQLNENIRYNNKLCQYLSKLTTQDIRCVEGIEAYKILDYQFGCDAFIFVNNKPKIGIALRNTFASDSFKIRYHLKSGNRTEYDKRIEAINNNTLYPIYTIQTQYNYNSYNSIFIQNNMCCQKIAIVKTKTLYQHIESNLKRYIQSSYTCSFDSAVFLQIPFAEVDKIKIIKK